MTDALPAIPALTDGVGKLASANRLGDGEVVFLTAAGDWSPRIDEGAVVAKADAAAIEAHAAAGVKARRVTSVEIIDVARENGRVRPLHIRERIRALGPTVRPDLGKQAEGTGGAFKADE
ncbi:MAG: DUF2849 domain-containing protein [Hyphomicrobiales bacterium]